MYVIIVIDTFCIHVVYLMSNTACTVHVHLIAVVQILNVCFFVTRSELRKDLPHTGICSSCSCIPVCRYVQVVTQIVIMSAEGLETPGE